MTFKIKNRIISNKTKPYIIAEMSSNHLGNIKNAKEIIKMAKMSGASAVKLQTFHPEDITLNSNSNIFKIKNGLWKDQTYFNLYKKIYMPMTKQVALFKYAKKIGITIFSSPLSIRNVDFLESMKVPAYKIPSFEANDFNLLNKCIKTGKPLIISTGTSYSYEIDEIITFIKKKKYLSKTALLHCCSDYPSTLEQANISFLRSMIEKYKINIGYSDHSLNSIGAICAIANGATIIEKHVITSRKLGGPDHKFSASKSEFKQYVKDCNNAWLANGNNKKRKIFNRKFKRSIYAIQNIKKGEKFTKRNIKSFRPYVGLDSKFYFNLINKKSKKNYKVGNPINK